MEPASLVIMIDLQIWRRSSSQSLQSKFATICQSLAAYSCRKVSRSLHIFKYTLIFASSINPTKKLLQPVLNPSIANRNCGLDETIVFLGRLEQMGQLIAGSSSLFPSLLTTQFGQVPMIQQNFVEIPMLGMKVREPYVVTLLTGHLYLSGKWLTL